MYEWSVLSMHLQMQQERRVYNGQRVILLPSSTMSEFFLLFCKQQHFKLYFESFQMLQSNLAAPNGGPKYVIRELNSGRQLSAL